MGRIFIGGFQLSLQILDVHKHFYQSDYVLDYTYIDIYIYIYIHTYIFLFTFRWKSWNVVSNLYMVSVIMIWKFIKVTSPCILFHKDSRHMIFSFIFFSFSFPFFIEGCSIHCLYGFTYNDFHWMNQWSS